MPANLRKAILSFAFGITLFLAAPQQGFPKEIQGIITYYVRLDHTYARNQSHHARITMVPAENEFRAENFSPIHVAGQIQASPQTSDQALEMIVKKNAFIQILENKGLCSVTTQNQETIVSYEGTIRTPMNIRIAGYDKTIGGFSYSARITFAPIAFPDQWDRLETRYRIKQLLDDFILFFK